jgi:phage tail protein X
MAPPMDCELVATWCERTYAHTGSVVEEVIEPLGSAASHVLRAGMFVVTMYRCTPAVPDSHGDSIALPSTLEEEAAARELYGDAQRVTNALRAAERAGELPACNGLAFDSWTGLGPEGGMVGGELRVRVGLATGV